MDKVAQLLFAIAEARRMETEGAKLSSVITSLREELNVELAKLKEANSGEEES